MKSKREAVLIMCLAVLFLILPTALYALTGYDYETGNYIEFNQDIPVGLQKDYDIFDYSDESFHTVHVITINNNDTEVVIEVYDYDEGEYRTFYMDEDTDNQQTTAELA